MHEETGLYYLQSRYYNPTIGRFINADDIDLLGTNGDFSSLNLFAYCGNDPVMRTDPCGGSWLGFALAGGGTMAVGSGISIGAIGSSVLAALGAITPAGWVAIGAVAVVGIVTIGITYAKSNSSTKSKEEVDPYARPGQKKQGRETKSKSRQKDSFKPRNNRRDKRPAPPKHHTPMRDHQKHH